MNKYRVNIRDRHYNDNEVEIEARSAADAITIADFNICQKSKDIEGKPTSWIVEVIAL